MSFAQNLQKEKVKVKYIALPSNPVPSNITTYSRRVQLPSSIADGSSRSTVESRLKSVASIPGFELSEDANDLKVYVRSSNFYNRNFESRTVEVEEKRGEEKVKVKYYVYDVEFKMPIYYEITLKGETVSSGYANNSNDYKKKTTQRFKTTSERYEWYKAKKSEYLKGIRESEFSANTGVIQSFLTKNYAFLNKEFNVPVAFVKTTKKKNYDELNAISTKMVNALNLVVAERGTCGKAYNDAAAKVIEEFSALLEKVDFKNKKALYNKKVGAYIAANIGILAFFQNDFEKATEMLQLADSYSKKSFIDEYKKQIGGRAARVEKYQASIVQ
ncbi:hypothetical protein NH26_08715 [Flammeovirga pacifica]|uniref:Uncharacterized protein n=2 Tax=Flammeovirga pacifica TaxID=915059 RepID=A0A1S1YZR6_FLAPC|nr:hypothetical protein NH26_08715 [Flammeovirga pacifica]